MTIERSIENGKFRRPFQGLQRAAMAAIAVVCLITPAMASGDNARCAVTSDALKPIKPLSSAKDLPAMTFQLPDGAELALGDLKGRGVVLNFWATWCAPCVREMPELAALKRDLAADGIEVLTVSLDRGGHKVIQTFLEKYEVADLTPLWDPKGTMSRQIGVAGLPTTLIIDADGRERARIQGIHHYDTAETRDYLKRCIGTP